MKLVAMMMVSLTLVDGSMLRDKGLSSIPERNIFIQRPPIMADTFDADELDSVVTIYDALPADGKPSAPEN